MVDVDEERENEVFFCLNVNGGITPPTDFSILLQKT
jgi:hypothetical protein